MWYRFAATALGDSQANQVDKFNGHTGKRPLLLSMRGASCLHLILTD